MKIKYKEFMGSTTRIVQGLPLAGYLVREEDLRHLDAKLISLPIFPAPENACASPTYLAFYSNGETCRFDSLAKLLEHPNTAPEIIEGLEIFIRSGPDARIYVLLEPDGDVTIDLIGASHFAEGAAHTIRAHLKALDQRYPWPARFFVLSSRFRRVTSMLAMLSVFALAFHIFFYIYAQFVGINVDPRLIPKGMTYYRQVEHAINSQNVADKLNVLLMGNYKDFTNASDFLVKYWARAGYALGASIILSLTAWVSRHMVKFYPR